MSGNDREPIGRKGKSPRQPEKVRPRAKNKKSNRYDDQDINANEEGQSLPRKGKRNPRQ